MVIAQTWMEILPREANADWLVGACYRCTNMKGILPCLLKKICPGGLEFQPRWIKIKSKSA